MRNSLHVNLIKNQIKKFVKHKQRKEIRKKLADVFYSGNLIKLALAHETDKMYGHSYCSVYQDHFSSIRHQKLNILEIGIGGYDDPKAGGNSLRMWKSYFPFSNIFGIDIFDKTAHDENRIKTFQGSQVDEEFLMNVIHEIGNVDIVIDDGSHISEHVIKTFKILFPLISPNGIYAIEDLQTSYWETVGGCNWGGAKDLNAPHTSMNFLKSMVDGLNYNEFTIDDFTPDYFHKHIISTHFYHNLAFVYKGINNEGSNFFGKRWPD